MRLSISFRIGFGRAFDLGATVPKRCRRCLGYRCDYDAIRGDWENVGRNIRRGIENYRYRDARS